MLGKLANVNDAVYPTLLRVDATRHHEALTEKRRVSWCLMNTAC